MTVETQHLVDIYVLHVLEWADALELIHSVKIFFMCPSHLT